MKVDTRDHAPTGGAQDEFIAAWGQMSSAWGISRTMAEVHALLYITGEALCTDDVMDRLQISRGNASMSLRALLEWGIVSKAHKRGDRKEYFLAEQDIWAMFRAIVRERLKREVEPLIAQLNDIRDRNDETGDAQTTADYQGRIDALVDFFGTVDRLGQRFASPSGQGLRAAATLLAKVS
ncbi:MAG: ArsR family transcriptional regulator [Planctomycetota bacterium]